MLLSSRLFSAINRASELHRDQIRKGKDMTPYVSHLYGVSYILSKSTDDEDVLIAGLLHDTLEDVPGYNKDKLEEEFGERVRQIVEGVTEPLDANKDMSEQKPWLERKEAYIEALRNGPKESAMVSCADKIHNLMSTERAFTEGDVVLAEKMLSAFRHQKLFYEKVYAVCEDKLGAESPLVLSFRETLARVIALFESKVSA